ncbi:MAG: hypothetical protein Q4B64_06450 [Spirochaetales bacterium]|nr:hypothetical protein [Spirochaetales bacterium]
MRNHFGLLIAIISIVLFGCVTPSNIFVAPSEYEEISCKNYFSLRDCGLYSPYKGYKITDVFIRGVDTRYENGTTETLLKLANDTSAWDGPARYVYATDFIKNKAETDPTWVDRVDAVANNKKYNGHYIVYAYERPERKSFDGYTTKVIIYDIEGVPTQEQIDSDKASAAAAAAAAEKKAKAEKYAKLNSAGKSLANGYTYHGVEEVEKNCKLFANGALESGHAYYISGFVVINGGSMATIEYLDGLFFSSQSNAVFVDYVNQKVKGEVVEACVKNLYGQTIKTPVTVIVAGGKDVTEIPVVLGIIEEK